MFTYATIPKHTMVRKSQELSPEEKRVVNVNYEKELFSECDNC